MKIRVIVFSLLFLLVASICGAGTLEDVEIVAEGCGQDLDEALLDAKRTAIEQGIGTLLVSQTEIENFMLKKDIVLTKTSGAVRRYEQLGTRQDEYGQCVSIRALVSMADIHDDLAALMILLESMARPRMMVLIQGEQAKAAETEIIDYLSAKEFDIVDPSMVATLQQRDADLVRQAVAGDPVAAAKIGADNGAEYILVGSVDGGMQENDLLAGSGMFSAQAQISARIINCSTTRIVAAKNEHAAMAHISKTAALQGAVLKTAQKLMDTKLFETIVSSFQNQVNNGQTIEVTVRGLGNYQLQKQVNSLISASSGVQSANKRSFSGGVLALTVMYRGTVDGFCETLDGQKVGDKKLAITDVIGSRIVVVLK
ncbi:MAG: hypothetical protein RBR22_02160 [Desulfuromonas sp.]|nr:hypothetical protein [Desulfuromonas sp.]